jgi:hypothetical protein
LTATRIPGQSQRNGQSAMENGGYAFPAAEERTMIQTVPSLHCYHDVKAFLDKVNVVEPAFQHFQAKLARRSELFPIQE